MQPSATARIRGDIASNSRVTSLHCASVISGGMALASWVILRKPLQVAAKEPIHTDFVLLAELHGVGGAIRLYIILKMSRL